MQRRESNNNSSPGTFDRRFFFIHAKKWPHVEGERRVRVKGGGVFFFFDDFFQHRSEGGGETLGKLMARCSATMRGRRSFPGNPGEISKRGATHESSGQMVPFPGSP